MKYLLLTMFTTLIATGCAKDRYENDLVEEQREELGIEDEGLYGDDGLYDDPDSF